MALYPTKIDVKKISGNAAAFLTPSAMGVFFVVDYQVDDTRGYKKLKYNITVDNATFSELAYRGSDGVIHTLTAQSGEIDISNYTSILIEGRYTSNNTSAWHRGYVYYELS